MANDVEVIKVAFEKFKGILQDDIAAILKKQAELLAMINDDAAEKADAAALAAEIEALTKNVHESLNPDPKVPEPTAPVEPAPVDPVTPVDGTNGDTQEIPTPAEESNTPSNEA